MREGLPQRLPSTTRGDSRQQLQRHCCHRPTKQGGGELRFGPPVAVTLPAAAAGPGRNPDVPARATAPGAEGQSPPAVCRCGLPPTGQNPSLVEVHLPRHRAAEQVVGRLLQPLPPVHTELDPPTWNGQPGPATEAEQPVLVLLQMPCE